MASFGPSRVCQWDILNTIATTTGLLFPVNLHLNKNHWILLIPAVLLLLFCPVFFDLAHGSSYYEDGAYAPNWSAASIFGSLFLFGPTPVIPYLPFAFVGMVMAHYMMEDKQATREYFSFSCTSSSSLFFMDSLLFCLFVCLFVFHRKTEGFMCIHLYVCHDDWC